MKLFIIIHTSVKKAPALRSVRPAISKRSDVFVLFFSGVLVENVGMMSWVVDPEVLILEVESWPLLYAKTLPEYSNKIMKNNTWEDVAKKLSEDWETLTNEEKISRSKDIQAKWKHLRDNFRREYQAQKEVASGQGAKKRKKYRYYDQLLFLIPHVKDAKTSGNYSTPANVSEENIENIENSPAESSTVTRSVSETTKKKKKTTSSFEDAILKAMNNEISEADEDKTYCLSLVQSLKKMDDDNKMLAKIEILKVIRTFTNKSHNIYNSEQNQTPFNRPNVVPYWNHTNSNFSAQSTPMYSQTTPQQQSQPTSTQAHNMYQQQSESNPTLSLH
ncbi:uncharacterized protein LOC126375541 isoform X1 [Pectinophora gossypiella]|uniref:uncharacterized protein LOC126375541 isoform X1 n=1 Tax=Pectinophora gossypiella TaxID=13191 RepID=UPI00214F3E95|nr:uncharacterized protein LOC126375541 isoform X1 [Pectinophora gossypiella]